ncbi:helix-turn-helix transcriptional regulator [Paenibacillus sp. NPDC058071]|uniref:helix-turn-helix transcriptional regulator n=1 Tax=Paenibacillus sp. NPDC058071 TaxID=3346326 RepID=UPI0036D97DAA
MKSDRLLAILLLLQNHGKLTTRELAERLEVSKRTINRDMDALSAAGVPVFAERGAYGGWALSERYRTDLTGMKTEEMLALLFGAPSRVMQDLGMRKPFEDAFEKLLAASPEVIREHATRVRNKIHVDGAGWRRSEESFPFLPAIQEALWEQRELAIRYTRDGTETERVVRPLGLVAKQSIWYLAAEAENEVKSYRISRLNGAEMLPNPFDYPELFNLAQYWEQSTKQFMERLPRYASTVAIREEALEAFARRRYVNIQRTGEPRRGMIEAEVVFDTEESACQLLLSFGTAVRALAPQALVDRMKAEIREIEALYSDS